jgi:hypothetical protein
VRETLKGWALGNSCFVRSRRGGQASKADQGNNQRHRGSNSGTSGGHLESSQKGSKELCSGADESSED